MLDIGVGDARYDASDPAEPWLGLDDDGYYWFLYPLFERLAEETGQFIDLYDYALFAGADLRALKRMLAEARQAVESQPESWSVQMANVPRLFRKIERAEFLKRLSAWEGAAVRAELTGRAVICFGD